jgi:Tfp pilus assembly protein PilX
MADPASLGGSGSSSVHQPMLTQRPHRRAQEGQVLIMALAFIAFFGLVTTAVLQFADTVQIQQSNVQSGAKAHADAEGGMLFAAEAASQQATVPTKPPGNQFPLGSCDARPGNGAAIAMSTPDAASYTTTACNAGKTADLIANQCAVCVLNPNGTPTPLSVEATPTAQGTLTAQGPIAVNGAASNSSSSPVKSQVPIAGGGLNPGFIGCMQGSPCSGSGSGGYSPPPSMLTRPPSNTVQAPSLYGNGNCNFQPWVPNPTNQISQGCYSSIDVACPGGTCAYTLGPGLVEVDGPFTIGTGSGSTTTVNASSSGGVLAFVPGGSLQINADGILNLQAPSGNGDVALYVAASGPITVAGGTLSVSGTIDAPNASVVVYGGPGTGPGYLYSTPASPPAAAGEDPDSGRLIVGTLDVKPYGVVKVTAMPPAPGGYCWVYDDNVLDSSGAVIGQVVVETDCGTGGADTGIISINYG